MGTIHEIEDAIRKLPERDLNELRRWFSEFDAGLWDRQLEEQMRTAPLPDDRRSFAQRLVELSVLNSGRDNTTAVIVELTATPMGATAPPS